MRHRATRPFTGLLLRLPRAAAQRLGLTAGGPRAPSRSGCWSRSSPWAAAATPSSLPSWAAAPARRRSRRSPRSRRSRRSRPGPEAGARDDGHRVRGPDSHRADPRSQLAPTSPRPEDSRADGGVSPSAGGASDRLPPIAVPVGDAVADAAAASTATGDVVPPDTTVSHEVTGPGAGAAHVLRGRAGDVRVQPRRRGVRLLRVHAELLRPRPGLAHLQRPRHRRRRERRRQPGQHPVALDNGGPAIP